MIIPEASGDMATLTWRSAMQMFKAIALGAAASIALAQTASAETRLSLSDVLPDGNFQVENAKVFADKVSEATNGEVVITVSAGGALGFKGPDQLAAVRDGLVDMADINISQQVGLNPLYGAEGVPFLVSVDGRVEGLPCFLASRIREARGAVQPEDPLYGPVTSPVCLPQGQKLTTSRISAAFRCAGPTRTPSTSSPRSVWTGS